jgi:hypothetical protein
MCGDLNGDAQIDMADFQALVDCMGQPPDASQACTCADMDGSAVVDLRDFALFALVFGEASDEVPPGCTGAVGAAANLTAYRPQHGAGYAPFARTAVAESDEDSETLGPGIRINFPGDLDPAGEDDLIEVQLDVDPPGAQLALRRSADALRAWTTRDKQPGTELVFVGDKTAALPLGPAQDEFTFWVEWAAPQAGVADLDVEALPVNVPKDTLVFHTFQSIVVALGGENQVPSDPPAPDLGTFVVAVDLYEQGYDVHMFDEDNVEPDGSGIVFDEVANAVQNRGVDEVAIFGYSHGGGATHGLADLLDVSRPTIGVFEIEFTSYVDAVRNSSDIDVRQELRRPPSSDFHLNQYQHGVFLEDFGLDGGPVPDSNPPPTGLDVETTEWGQDATHFTVDDFVQVRDLIQTSLQAGVPRERRISAVSTIDVIRGSNLRRVGGARRSALLMPVILASVAGGIAADAAGDDQAKVDPDPAFQAAVASVVRAADEQQQRAALGRLRAMDDAAREQLIRQLVYYSSHAANTKDAMAAGAVIHWLGIPDSAVVSALVPLLDTPDADMRRSARGILRGFESWTAGHRPDFSVYRENIADRLRGGEEPPVGLIQHLYEADPGEALLTLMRAYQLREPGELKLVLWAEHVVSDVLWKQQYGFLSPDEIEPAAAEELVRLSTHPAWWARLYVAETMRQHPAFRQSALIAHLARDPHPLVRAAISTIQSER